MDKLEMQILQVLTETGAAPSRNVDLPTWIGFIVQSLGETRKAVEQRDQRITALEAERDHEHENAESFRQMLRDITQALTGDARKAWDNGADILTAVKILRLTERLRAAEAERDELRADLARARDAAKRAALVPGALEPLRSGTYEEHCRQLEARNDVLVQENQNLQQEVTRLRTENTGLMATLSAERLGKHAPAVSVNRAVGQESEPRLNSNSPDPTADLINHREMWGKDAWR